MGWAAFGIPGWLACRNGATQHSMATINDDRIEKIRDEIEGLTISLYLN